MKLAPQIDTNVVHQKRNIQTTPLTQQNMSMSSWIVGEVMKRPQSIVHVIPKYIHQTK